MSKKERKEEREEESQIITDILGVSADAKQLSLGQITYLLGELRAEYKNSTLTSHMASEVWRLSYGWREESKNIPVYPAAAVHMDALARLDELGKNRL